jgi:hypothetical protein
MAASVATVGESKAKVNSTQGQLYSFDTRLRSLTYGHPPLNKIRFPPSASTSSYTLPFFDSFYLRKANDFAGFNHLISGSAAMFSFGFHELHFPGNLPHVILCTHIAGEYSWRSVAGGRAGPRSSGRRQGIAFLDASSFLTDNEQGLLSILSNVRSVMISRQIPFSCYPPCARLSFESTSVICMNNVDAKPRSLYLCAFIKSEF